MDVISHGSEVDSPGVDEPIELVDINLVVPLVEFISEED